VSADVPRKNDLSADVPAGHGGAGMITSQMVAAEMRDTVRAHVRILCTENLQRAQEAASRIYGMSARRVRAYWNNEIKTVPAHEADSIRAAKVHIAKIKQQKLNAELLEIEALLKQIEAP
jgi:hypothetical protein